MSKNDPHVQVFHFTSKISNAKIKKYQVATSRGMSHPDGPSNFTPPSDASSSLPGLSMPTQPIQQSPGTVASPRDEQAPPPKKRLKLHVRQPGPPPSAYHQNESPLAKPAESPNTSLEADNLGAPSASLSRVSIQKARDGSSDLSSVRSSPAPDAPRSKPRDKEYGDLMSYYIVDSDKDDDKHMTSPTDPVQRAQSPQPPKPQPGPQPESKQKVEKRASVRAPAHVKAQSSKKPGLSREQAPVPDSSRPTEPAQHAPSSQHAMPPIPIPRVILIDLEQEPRPQLPGHRETVRDMIDRLQVLSEALGPFAGIPGFPKTDPTPQATKSRPSPANENNLIDGFLDMFETESTDDETEILDEMDAPLEDFSKTPGSPDSDLIYGIQFIMNALRSWAHQRLQVQFNKQFLEAKHKQQAERMLQQAQPKRGPGRPRKFSATSRAAEHAAEAPGDVHMSLDNTPEGHAVRAFQEVLRSGCLQINGLLPAPLTQALTHIYMQIDRLINHGNTRDDPNWHPVSYICQIEANQMVVEKWKEDQARMQEVSARQQQLNDRKVMAQMRAFSQQHHVAGVEPSNSGPAPPQQILPSQREQKPVRNPFQTRPAPPAPLTKTAPPMPSSSVVASTAPKAPAPFIPTQAVRKPLSVSTSTPVAALPTGARAIHAALREETSVTTPIPVTAPLRGMLAAHRALDPAPAPPARAHSLAVPVSPVPATPPKAKAPKVKTQPPPDGPKSKPAPAQTEKRKAAGTNQAMANIKMYMPGWQPRSGAQIKFSYAPTAQPQPQPQQYHMPHNLPPQPHPPPHVRPMPMQPPIAQTMEGPPPRIHSSPVGEEIVVASAQRDSKSTTPAHTGMRRTPSDQAESSMAPSAVPGNGHQAQLPGESSPALGSTSATVSRMNNDGPTAYTASRFPHPGAVIVDQ